MPSLSRSRAPLAHALPSPPVGCALSSGAHIGFEENDPIAQPASEMLGWVTRHVQALGTSTSSEQVAGNWMMVEAAPANFKVMVKNLDEQKIHHIKFRAVNAGVTAAGASSSDGSSDELTFYSISNDVDAVSGEDNRTGKMLDFWVTQIGSFHREQVTTTLNQRAFNKQGLDIEDYIIETSVPAFTVANLLENQGIPQQNVDLLLVDTEGLDCQIIMSLDLHGDEGLRPSLVVFEHSHCKEHHRNSLNHLRGAGYTTFYDRENSYAIRKVKCIPH